MIPYYYLRVQGKKRERAMPHISSTLMRTAPEGKTSWSKKGEDRLQELERFARFIDQDIHQKL